MLAAQAVTAAAGAQRGALEQEPVDAAQARVGEQPLKTKAGAPVGAQVTRVDEPLSVGFDQRARASGAEWSTGTPVMVSAPTCSDSPSGSSLTSAGSAASGKKIALTSKIASEPRLA